MLADQAVTSAVAPAGSVVAAGLSPHPPIIIPEIGGPEVAKAAATVQGVTELTRRLVAARPDTVVIISPHGPVLRRSFVVYGHQEVGGDFGEFGAPTVQVVFPTDHVLIGAMARLALAEGVSLTDLADGSFGPGREDAVVVHYAVLVPLFYLHRAGFTGRVVVINMAYTALAECYRFGQLLERAVRESGRRVAVLASGDLSHRLVPGAPAGYDRRGAEFDRLLMDAIRANDSEAVLGLDPALIEAAGECGLRPVVIMLGAAQAAQLTPEVLSYEGPFGVGYGTAFFAAAAVAAEPPGEHPLVALARRTVETYVRTGEIIDPPDGALASDLPAAAGAFVSLHRAGRLRGCIGTIGPTRHTLAAEVIHNAIAAATEDPRFRPLTARELGDLEISVDVLGQPEPITSRSQLDPRQYGVIVERGQRRGLLLPDLEGVDSVDEQVAIAAQKAGLNPADPALRLSRFRVVRYH